MNDAGHCHSRGNPHERGPVRLGLKVKLAIAALLVIFLVSFLPGLEALNVALREYFRQIWWAVLLGLLLGGVIDYFVPDVLVRRWLGGRAAWSIPRAVVVGFLMAACSHGILAIAIELYRKGAGVPAVVAFLLASPWANLPITLLLFSFFGWQALFLVGGAMLVALVTGFIFLGLERRGWVEQALPGSSDELADWSRLQEFDRPAALRGVWRGALSLANMVLWWIILGFLMAALIQAFVPGHWFMTYAGPGFLGLLVTLAVATVIEVCSEGSAPIAFEIYRQVESLGNPFVFLMAGVVTDYTEIGLLWTSIGRRTALWLPVVAVPQVLMLAWLMNHFLL